MEDLKSLVLTLLLNLVDQIMEMLYEHRKQQIVCINISNYLTNLQSDVVQFHLSYKVFKM